MQPENKRDNWKSSVGFVLAAAGSAIGVGNVWRFSHVMGSGGGFWFLLIYIAIVLLFGIPLMLGEIAVGRHTKKSAVGAFSQIKKGFGFVGVLAIVAPFLCMTYYGIVGGWALKYTFDYVFAGSGSDFVALVGGRAALGAWQPLLWTALFLLVTWSVCLFGASGIEKISKVVMPVFFVLLILVIIRSVTLPGAGEGLRFMFANTSGFSLQTIPMALGQAFFSLSLAMGILVTYGSYLKKDVVLPKTVMVVAGLDTVAAVMAGLAIFPAVFATGGQPDSGSGLAFITLPATFDSMPFGRAVGAAFFLLLFFAALTSAISLVETCISFVMDTWKWKRKTAVTVLILIFCAASIPNSFSIAEGTVFSGNNFLGSGMPIFDAVDSLTSNVILPLGGVLTCILIGWFWKPESAIAEIESTPGYVFRLKKAWSWIIKFLAPALLLIVLVSEFVM